MLVSWVTVILKQITKVFADACPVGLEADLVQGKGSNLTAFSYASRRFSTVERKYSQIEKEAIELVWACERFYVTLFRVILI